MTIPTARLPQRALAFALSSGTFLLVNRVVGDASPAFLDWGWRVPFIASSLLVAVGLYVRLKVEETPMFRETTTTRASTQGPLAAALKHQWKEILLGGGSLAMLFAFFYIGTAFLTSYGTTVIGLSNDDIDTLKKFSVEACRSKFAVAADANGKTIKDYDVALKMLPGATMADRVSYLIGTDGKVAAVHASMNPDGHIDAMLKAAEKLKK